MEKKEKQVIETLTVKPKMAFFEDEEEYRFITREDEKKLDEGVDDIGSFMANNEGFGKSDEIKDNLYGKAQEMWKELASNMRDIQYTFYFNRKQYNYITDLLIRDIVYNVDSIFLGIYLTTTLAEWKESGEKYKNDVDYKSFKLDATNLTYAYHLISKHTIKGLTDKAYLFAEILRKIGDLSKIINYYDNAAKQLSADIQKWVAAFEPEEENKKENIIEK